MVYLIEIPSWIRRLKPALSGHLIQSLQGPPNSKRAVKKNGSLSRLEWKAIQTPRGSERESSASCIRRFGHCTDALPDETGAFLAGEFNCQPSWLASSKLFKHSCLRST